MKNAPFRSGVQNTSCINFFPVPWTGLSLQSSSKRIADTRLLPVCIYPKWNTECHWSNFDPTSVLHYHCTYQCTVWQAPHLLSFGLSTLWLFSHIFLFWFGGKTTCAIKQLPRPEGKAVLTTNVLMQHHTTTPREFVRLFCFVTWADRFVYMRNSRGLKVPPPSLGGFKAQNDICGPQAHKILQTHPFSNFTAKF